MKLVDKKSDVLYSDVVNSTRKLRESFLKERELAGIKKHSIKHLDIEDIYNYVKTSWNHETGTFNILTELSFVNNDNKETRTVKVKLKGFNQYGIHDGDHNEEGIINQEKNTVSLNKEHLSRISKVCTPMRNLITYIEMTYGLKVTSSTLLRQSTSGIEGAKEAIFG